MSAWTQNNGAKVYLHDNNSEVQEFGKPNVSLMSPWRCQWRGYSRMRGWRVTRLDEGGTPSHGPKFCQTEHPLTTPTISVCLTLRLLNRAYLHTRLFSSTHTRLKEKSKSSTFLISRTTSMSKLPHQSVLFYWCYDVFCAEYCSTLREFWSHGFGSCLKRSLHWQDTHYKCNL
jgi:hypothetical protein